MVCSVDAVTLRVNDWARSWRQKDYTSYSQFYAAQFTPEPPLNRDAWAKQRRARLLTNGKINLDINNLQVTCDGDKATATFDQAYSVTTIKLLKPKNDFGCQICNAKRVATKDNSNNVSKELQFEQMGGQYQIVREIVKK